MYLKITKSGDKYVAEVQATESNPAWKSSKPMGARELYDALESIGCHPVDILEELNFSDPGWDKRTPGFGRKT
ncbi:MAG: hypothetical protein QOI63_1977 [Thermoplasmata archaeon]|nr:hypothetical protein [Thermoplasmata archaeon]